jgi:hypothetical protein
MYTLSIEVRNKLFVCLHGDKTYGSFTICFIAMQTYKELINLVSVGNCACYESIYHHNLAPIKPGSHNQSFCDHTILHIGKFYMRKKLTSCNKFVNKPSTTCLRTACHKLSTGLEQAVNNL